MKTKTVQNVVGLLLILAATVLSFLLVNRGSFTVIDFLVIGLIYTVGGNLVSHSQTKDYITGIVVPLIDAWRRPAKDE